MTYLPGQNTHEGNVCWVVGELRDVEATSNGSNRGFCKKKITEYFEMAAGGLRQNRGGDVDVTGQTAPTPTLTCWRLDRIPHNQPGSGKPRQNPLVLVLGSEIQTWRLWVRVLGVCGPAAGSPRLCRDAQPLRPGVSGRMGPGRSGRFAAGLPREAQAAWPSERMPACVAESFARSRPPRCKAQAYLWARSGPVRGLAWSQDLF